jgi:hypothetical protein
VVAHQSLQETATTASLHHSVVVVVVVIFVVGKVTEKASVTERVNTNRSMS